MSKIEAYNFAGKKAIVRVDFNVPLNDKFEITDDTRIRAAMPTIQKILKDGGSAIIMSHLGRPKGKKNPDFSLQHIQAHLAKTIGTEVIFAGDCVGAELKTKYYDARHHCYAWQLGTDGMNFRANDDGEPSGTAGKPIHGQIRSHELTNVLIVVVRYFGGTKLGTSGLIHAYKTAAADALAQAVVVEKT